MKYLPFSIDLHTTENITDALEKMEHDLFVAFQRKETQVKIVYGIGTGVLRAAVLEALRKNPMIKDVREEEGEASCVVYL